jgi:hypothetical protein
VLGGSFPIGTIMAQPWILRFVFVTVLAVPHPAARQAARRLSRCRHPLGRDASVHVAGSAACRRAFARDAPVIKP